MDSFFTGIHQIGLVVKDCKKTIRDYSDIYGIGPWNIWQYDSSLVQDMTVYGKRLDYKMMVATCKSSNIDYEIIGPLDEVSIYHDFLAAHGEGLQHINYTASDFDSAVKLFENSGSSITQFGNFLGRHKYVYFDTEQYLKHTAEIAISLPGFVRLAPLSSYPPAQSAANTGPFYERIEYIGIFTCDIEKTMAVYKDRYHFKSSKFSDFSLKNEDDGAVSNSSASSRINTGGYINISAAEYKFGKEKIILFETPKNKNSLNIFNKSFHEGMHHVGYAVRDFGKAIDFFNKKKINVIASGKFNDKKFAFLDTEKHLKFNMCIY